MVGRKRPISKLALIYRIGSLVLGYGALFTHAENGPILIFMALMMAELVEIREALQGK